MNVEVLPQELIFELRETVKIIGGSARGIFQSERLTKARCISHGSPEKQNQ
jgi:hypothetical protein